MIRAATLLALLLAAPALADEPGHDDHGHEAADQVSGHQVSGHDEDHDHEEGIAHVFRQGDVRVVHPWARATDSREAFVFLDFENLGATEIVLQGASADWAETAGLAGFVLKEGEGVHVPVAPVPVAGGRELVLRPQELSIRLEGIAAPLKQGGHVHLVLQTSAGPVAIDAEIEAADAMQHSHAGHKHMEH